jgi:glycosyltransferase involved in cell wall biosynthesis
VHDYYDPAINCECIPLGIPRRNNTSTPQRGRYNLAPDDILLVTVGRLVARKAVDQLIAMVGKLDNCRVHLLVVGSGPQEAALKSIAQETGVGSQIHFLGQISEQDKFEVLQMADIYTSTSQHEGFGIVYLEAMASALPVVCYDFGGQTDFLKTGVNGYLVKLNDIAGFQRACQNLIDDPELRRTIGKQNVSDVEGYYVDNCAQRYAGLYKDILLQYGAGESTGDQPG